MVGNPFSEFLASGAFLSTGREGILQEIAQVMTLPSPDDRDLHGLPGMGKTDILRYVRGPEFIERYRRHFFAPYAEEPHLLFIVIIAGWIESIHPFVLLYRQFVSAYRTYRDAMAAEHPAVALPAAPADEIDDLDGGLAMSLLEPLLRSLIKARVRVALLLDDFDSDLAYARLNADETSRLSSWKEYCSFILATERRLEDVNPKAKGSPFYKRLTQTPMRDFLSEESREFVAAILNEHQASLPKGDLDSLIKLAGGFPYLLILAGRALWDLRLRTGLGKSPETPLPVALQPYLEDRLAGEFRRMFELYFEGRTEVQRRVLLDLAINGPVKLESEPGDPQYIQLMGLEQYGLVDVDGEGRVTLFSQLFRAYLVSLARDSGTEPDGGEEPVLTGLQTNLYNIFRDKPDELLTFEELGQRVWSWPADPKYDPPAEEKRKIQIAVSKLRRALEDSGTGERIVNLRNKGYRFEPAR